MIYDYSLKKGVMKRDLPGPRIMEFVAEISYADFIDQLKPSFFADDVTGKFAIANSSGIPYDVVDTDWDLKDFVKTHGPPSKLRIYLLLFPVRLTQYIADLSTRILWTSK